MKIAELVSLAWLLQVAFKVSFLLEPRYPVLIGTDPIASVGPSSIGCVYSRNCNYALVLVSPLIFCLQFIVSSLLNRGRLILAGCIE